MLLAWVRGELCTSIADMCEARSGSGDYGGARRYYEESLAMKREVYGADAAHANIASTLSNLGLVCHAEGDYGGARRYHEESLAMEREVYGADAAHADIANT